MDKTTVKASKSPSPPWMELHPEERDSLLSQLNPIPIIAFILETEYNYLGPEYKNVSRHKKYIMSERKLNGCQKSENYPSTRHQQR
jgi:hypothetical protein